ncbi:MAG: 1,4-alpha-glucan branching protein domain-containing protein [Nitrospirota bacterium]
MKGSLLLLLHAHLPYVRHPEYEYALEESWLYEALWETYLPLLDMLERQVEDGISPQLAFSLSPPLIEMLDDELLRIRFLRHLDNLIELAGTEKRRTRHTPFEPAAFLYAARLKKMRRLYRDRYAGDIVAAFRKLQDEGHIEIVATSATHAFLPAYEHYPGAVRRQIAVGIGSYRRAFGRRPRGFWLPECGYFRGLDAYLKEAGIDYFFLEAHGVVHGRPRPRFSIYRPVTTPSGAVAFARDTRAAQQVWCASRGYPGDPWYRDFYRDIGFDLPSPLVEAFTGIGIPSFTGLKYHRITGAGADKMPYDRCAAIGRAAEHAAHFVGERAADFGRLGAFSFSPVLFTAFDAELFGHWWFEGVEWLDGVVRTARERALPFRLETPLALFRRRGGDNAPGDSPAVEPAPSSWGEGGYNAVWIGEQNRTIYRHLHRMAERVERLIERARRAPAVRQQEGSVPRSGKERTTALMDRAINQAVREALLAQASDWAFLMERDRAAAYAAGRIAVHRERFDRIFSMICGNGIDASVLGRIEAADPLFPWLEVRDGTAGS